MGSFHPPSWPAFSLPLFSTLSVDTNQGLEALVQFWGSRFFLPSFASLFLCSRLLAGREPPFLFSSSFTFFGDFWSNFFFPRAATMFPCHAPFFLVPPQHVGSMFLAPRVFLFYFPLSKWRPISFFRFIFLFQSVGGPEFWGPCFEDTFFSAVP